MPKIFYNPIGGTMGDPLNSSNKNSSLEQIIDIQFLMNNLDKENNNFKQNKKKLSKILKKNIKEMPIWGFSSDSFVSSDKSKEYMEEDDIVFFGYKNCILYMGQVQDVFTDKNLSTFLWDTKGKWAHKVLLKRLLRIYIPANKFVYDKYPEFREGIKNSDYILRELKNDNNFRTILQIKKAGNIQGTRIIEKDPEKVSEILNDLEIYFCRTNYQPLIKVIYKLEE